MLLRGDVLLEGISRKSGGITHMITMSPVLFVYQLFSVPCYVALRVLQSEDRNGLLGQLAYN